MYDIDKCRIIHGSTESKDKYIENLFSLDKVTSITEIIKKSAELTSTKFPIILAFWGGGRRKLG